MAVLKYCFLVVFSLALCLMAEEPMAQQNSQNPRIIITADPELDDNNSLIRFLLYSASFRVDGLIYASSQFHWKGDGKGTRFMVPGREYTRYGLNLCPCESYRWNPKERFIHQAVEAYEKVYRNLVVHDKNYPHPEVLKSKIRYGNIDFEGDFTKDTEGSDLIKAAILDDEPGPLYITAWGGQSTIARALKSIEEQFSGTRDWVSLKKKISAKVILLPSGDQDGTYASYIKPGWPEIEYRQYRNGPNYGYGAQLVASDTTRPFLTPRWMSENIRSKGPFGHLYRVWGDGKHMVAGDRFDYFGMDGYTDAELKAKGYIVWMPVQAKGSWLGEGDTGTFMNILSNGLNAWDRDSPGGWGGRPFNPNPQTYIDPFSNDTARNKDLVISAETLKRMQDNPDELAPFPQFFPAAQLDFAARMDWSVKSRFSDANHAPAVVIQGGSVYTVRAGQVLELLAQVTEPDGNQYTSRWWQFKQYSQTAPLGLSDPGALKTRVNIPAQAKPGDRFFLVLEVRESNTQPLTAYQLVKFIVS